MPGARTRFLLLIPATLLLLVVLGPVLTGPFFSDDFQFVLDDPTRHVLGSFGELHPYRLYRPLQLSIIALSQTLFGETTLPVRIVAMAVHLALIALILRAFGRLGLSLAAASAATLWLASSQLLPPAVGGNDTISLVLGTFFGSLAAWWLWPVPARGVRERRLGYALVAYTLALLSKESSLGYLPVLAALLAVPPRESARRAVLVALALSGVTVGYLLLRQSLGAEGPRFGPDGNWTFGTNLLVNAVQLGITSLLSVSTVDVFTGVMRKEWGVVLLAGAGLLALAIIVGAGLGPRRIFGLAIGTVLSLAVLAPVLPMRHVSELYAYALLPPAALLVGVGVGGAWSRGGTGRRAGLVLVLVLLVLGQADAARRKSRDMARNGHVAGPLLGQLIAVARHLPSGGTLILVEPEPARPQYSVYHMDGFRLTPPEEIVRLSGRKDLHVLQLPANATALSESVATGTLRLTLAEGELIPLVPAEGLPLFSRP